MTTNQLERGRAAYGRRSWAEAHEALSGVAERAPLGPGDLELLVTAAYMLGRDTEFERKLERAPCPMGGRRRAQGRRSSRHTIGTVIDLTLCETEDDLGAADAALHAMSPTSGGSGRRTPCETFEVVLDVTPGSSG
ncbi:MAG: hypothetical protein OEW31_09770 [Thermoleophilia bacterium]|nr:hypothetical protein [Thermoleophilia bacterium]